MRTSARPEEQQHIGAGWPPDLEDAAAHDPLLRLFLRGEGPPAVARRLRRPDGDVRGAVERVISTPCAFDLHAPRWDEARAQALPAAARRRERARFDAAAREVRGRAQGLLLAARVARGDPRLSATLHGWFVSASPMARVLIARAMFEEGPPPDRAWLDALATLLNDPFAEPDAFAISLGARAALARATDGGIGALAPRLDPARVLDAPWRAQGVLAALAEHTPPDRAWLTVLRPLLAIPAVGEDVAVVLARYTLDAGWVADLTSSIEQTFGVPGVLIDQRLAVLAPIADARAVPTLTRALRANPALARVVTPVLARLGASSDAP